MLFLVKKNLKDLIEQHLVNLSEFMFIIIMSNTDIIKKRGPKMFLTFENSTNG